MKICYLWNSYNIISKKFTKTLANYTSFKNVRFVEPKMETRSENTTEIDGYTVHYKIQNFTTPLSKFGAKKIWMTCCWF